jgi:ATP-binding cassette, subfamily B, bacterial
VTGDPTIIDVDRPMRRLFGYLRPMRGRLGLSVTSSVINKVLDLAPPILVAWLIDCVTGMAPVWMRAGLGITTTMGQIIFIAVLTVIIFALESLSQWGYTYGFMTVSQDMQHNLRIDAYSRMQDREIRFFEEHRLGKTLAMLNDDVNQLERFFNSAFNEIVQIIVLILFAGAVMFTIAPSLAFVGLVTIPIVTWGSLRFSKLLEPRYKGVRESVG